MAPFMIWPLFWLLLGAYSVAEEPEFKLVCYYTNWAIYRPNTAKFTPENINPYLCTHLIYAFGGLSPRFEIKPFDSYNDIQLGNYKKFVDLKKHNSKLKTMIAIGGWNEGSKKFSKMVASEENRQTFVRSVMKFLRQHKFDGLDLDWEYPTFRDGSHPEDREGYLELLRELRKAIDSEKLGSSKERLLLTMAVPAGQQYIEQGYSVEEMAKEVDFFNLLTYDYYTTQEGSANHHSALFEVEEREDWDPKRLLNVDWTVNTYIELGAPPNKLVVGVPTYGRAFTLEDAQENELGSPIKGPAEAGNSTREEGYLGYYEICKMLKNDEWQVKIPFPDALGPYAYKGDQWVGYDDETIVATKAKYVVEHKLGGVMFWALDTDDFRGDCGEKSPLITAARKVLLSTSSRSPTGTTRTKPTSRTTTTTTTTTTTRTTTTEPPTTVETLTTTETDDTNEDEDIAIDQLQKMQEDTIIEHKKHENRINERSDHVDRLTTPVPPTTPDPGPEVQCKDEGFFANPKDCRKYYWCLDSGPADLGIVPHHFTCPSGLHFNTFTDSCDYAENVKCKIKAESSTSRPTTTKTTRPKAARITTARTTTTTTELEEAEDTTAMSDDDAASTNPSIAQLLHLIKTLGGVEQVEKHLGISKKEDPKVAETTTTTNAPATSRSTPASTRATTEKRPSSNVAVEKTNRRGSIRHRTATATTEKSSVSTATRRPRLRARTTSKPPTTEESITSRSSSSRSRSSSNHRQKQTSTAATISEAIDTLDDSSSKYKTIQRTAASRPLIADVNVEETRIASEKSTTATNINQNGNAELETFEATRIPGLFRYIPLRRGGTTTESSVDVAEQLRQILNAADKAAEDSKTNEDVSANESTNNVHITLLDLSTPSQLEADPPPFENIGVHLDNFEQSSDDVPLTSKELLNADENDKYEDLSKERIIDSKADVNPHKQISLEDENLENTITSTEPETKEVAPLPTSTSISIPKRKIMIRKRITVMPRSTTLPPTRLPRKPSTTSTESAPPTISIARKINLSSNRSARPRLTSTAKNSTPDPSNPLSVRVKFIRRPGSDPGSSFQGLTINDKGDLECIEQGVYPHPVECDKFVSCVSVRGSIILWTYACSNNQLYDDFTGRCLDEELVECDLVE